MDRKILKAWMIQSDTVGRLSDKPDYYIGYSRGLRRLLHGAKFGTMREYSFWLSLVNDSEDIRAVRGRGYQDGYSGMAPNSDKCDYCTQSNIEIKD